MTKKEMTKKQLEDEVASLEANVKELTERLQNVSAGYQAALGTVSNLQALVERYEETINILTGRLIEARRQVNREIGRQE